MPVLTQVLFLFSLHGLGSLFGLSFKRYLPLPFLCISGLLWGCLLWVLSALLILVTGVPYTLLSMAVLLAIVAVVLGIWNFNQGNFSFSAHEWRWSVGSLLVVGLLFTFASYFVMSAISPDSLYLILNGRAFSSGWETDFIRQEIAQRGIFLPLIQSASTLLELDYLNAIQPSLTGVFAGLFLFFGFRILKHLVPLRTPYWMVIAGLITFGSTHFIVYQTFYIQTNLLSGFFFLLAVSCTWLALKENNHWWLVFTILALTVFGFLRTEAPLFSLLFLVVLIGQNNLTYKERLAVVIPFTILFALWYLYLLVGMRSGTHILDPFKTGLIIAALLGFTVFTVISRLSWIEKNLLPRLGWLLLGGLFLACVILFILRPTWVAGCLATLLTNITVYGLWGVSWFVIAAGILIAISIPSFPYERIFFITIPAFLLFLFALVTQSEISRLDWGDSANRMLTHIFPTILLYLSVKLGYGITSPLRFEVSQTRRIVMASTGLFLIVFTIAGLLSFQ